MLLICIWRLALCGLDNSKLFSGICDSTLPTFALNFICTLSIAR